VKSVAILALTLALITVTAKATLAHVDSLGEPDPRWQQIAAASAARNSQVPPEGTVPDDFISSRELSLLLWFISALALDQATVGRGKRARRMPATAPPGPAAMMREEPLRTVEVLPPSESNETRVVLRVAVAIVFAALFVSGLHASNRGSEGGPPAHADSSLIVDDGVSSRADAEK